MPPSTRFYLLFLILFFAVVGGRAQELPGDSLLHGDHLTEFVVTATRSDRKLADVPIPVTLINQEQIQSSGASRLDELLSEQTGLTIITDHGSGVQMQGMDPEYCLILINGEPAIGRTAGTFDLTRITLNDVKRIEIIKGPSSSLYGSDALAGVINIITKKNQNTGISVHTKYGSNATLDNTLTLSSALKKKGTASLSINRFHTEGYDLTPETYGKTVDPYTNYTFQGNLHYQLTSKLKITLNGQYFSEKQKSDYLATPDKDTLVIKGDGETENKRLNPILSYKVSPSWNLKLRTNWSQYKTKSNLFDQKADTSYEHTFFRQTLWKEELQSENILNANQILTTGIGFKRENLKASRYASREFLSTHFFYAQHEWRPKARWNILSGIRFDAPSAYDAQLSPKIAAQYQPDKRWLFRASIGMGYKAPDFRQLYLNFSNPVAGYSVLGAKTAGEGLKKMQQNGQIEKTFVQPDEDSKELKPESSIAYNIGATYKAPAGWKLEANFFRNDVKDMIDTRTIARKTNGQPLYSYYNINRVFTEGAEINGSLPLFNKKMIVNAGYQFLIARDKEVVNEIKAGKKFKRNPQTQKVQKVTMADYGGLFHRSAHSFNVKLYYTHQSWSANVRFQYRSRFGFADLNGTNILDQDDEYAAGYVLGHLNVAKSLMSEQLKIQVGIKDLFNYTDPQHLPYVSGRRGYISISFHFFKNQSYSFNQ